MIDHDRARELAASELDFALSLADREELQGHLDDCQACRTFDEQLRADARSVSDLAPYDAPDALRARIVAVAGTTGAFDAPADVSAGRQRSGGAPRALSIIPPRYHRPAALLAAAAVVVALVGGTLYWRESPTAAPGTAVASPSGSAPSGSGSPAPSGEPGSPVDAEIWKPVADLTADDEQGGVVALGSGFRLASLDGTPAAELATRLTADPPIAFAVTADADGRSARITPSEPLSAGAVYTFTLAAKDGRTLDSWAFQAHQPLRIVETLPGDAATGVPVKTGIEFTFDQDGVVDAASHVTIAPKVDGRFEEHGRVLAFVPAKPLKPATIYTVTVSRGIKVGGTGEVLESDVRFAFETAKAGGAGAVRTTFRFTDDLFESATADRPAIALRVSQDWDEDQKEPAPPKTAKVEVHRLPDLDRAIDAYRQVRSFPDWALWSAADLVPTTDLDRVAALDAKLGKAEDALWFQLPARLPAGSYVVTIRSGTRPAQTILQVTDLSAYLVVSETRTLVWANDLATGGPVVGATVAAAGSDLGRTGDDGTRIADTPAALLASQDDACIDGCIPVVTVRSGDRATFLPVSGQRGPEGAYDGWDQWAEFEGEDYWHAFDTDRTLYRRTDTVNTWGLVRDRATGQVPSAVTIRLYVGGDEGPSDQGPALVLTEVHPDAVGAFSGSIALRDVPEGQYRLELRAGTDVVASRSIEVGRILKPAYRLEVTTGRRVYFNGDQVKVTATATFYEGSPVPGLPLRLDGLVEKTFTTDAAGTATTRTKVGFEPGDWRVENGTSDVQQLTVNPARAEEGEIFGAGREILVFPSSWTVDATAQISGGRVQVTGSVHAVDRDRLEREIAAGASVWELHPAGAPMAGKTVTATFTELIPYRIKTGTRYDFIEKKVVSVYDYGTTDRAAGTVRVKTGADGTFSASVGAAVAGHSYRVALSATDPDKHPARSVTWAIEPGNQEEDAEPSLGLTSDPAADDGGFGVGDPIDLTMTDPGVPAHVADRYLFYTAQQGLRDARVQSSARFRGTFEPWAPPGIAIGGIRFTGSGYVESPTFYANFRMADRAISVGLTTDAARYDPGAEVTMTVTTRDPTGKPIPATVVLRAVDEKLFTMGGAEAADPLGELYFGVGSGIVATYRTHHEPPAQPDGGDTAGGGGDESGGRQDFRDSVLFRQVDTGQEGRAVVTFRVADDLTSWRVSASAFGADLTAGEAFIQIPVGLPFFVDATMAPEYLVSDRPSIGLRTYGTALEAGAAVTFKVDSDTLKLHVTGVRAKAFETATVPLPKLTVGSHKVTITASTGSGTSARRDVMTRTLTVVPSRLTRTRTDYVEPTGATRLEGGDGLVDVVVSDPGAARYVQLLLGLTGVESARLERTLAAALAGDIATDRFDLLDTVPPTGFDGATYQANDGGLAILPYAGSNLEASALAALVAPGRFDVDRLAAYLSTMAGNAKETRERRNIALAGLGGLHAAVLPRLRVAAADPQLTVRERLWLGLGAAALGDSATARSIGAGLVSEFGEVTTEHARLRAGDTAADITAGTALMAMLAAANGDALAPRFWAYVEADPGTEATYALHAVGYVTRMLERAAPRAATFAYTIGGKREVVELEPGETFRMALTKGQLATFTIEPVSGQVGVASSWREPVKPSAFAKDPDITISRRVTPSGKIGTAAFVTVDLTVRLGAKAPKGCHLVTDLLPSGLVAVGHLEGWVDPDEDEPAPRNVEYPYAQVGQRVSFCAERGKSATVVRLRYFARVVTAGTYAWEPAIVESRTATGRAALTKATVITIR